MGIPTILPASWEICKQVKKQKLEQDMEQRTGSKLGKEYVKAVYCHLVYLTYMQWQPTPVLLPGKSHGRRSLVGCSPWGRWGSDTTERLALSFSLSCIGEGNGNPLTVLAWRIPGTGEPSGHEAIKIWFCKKNDGEPQSVGLTQRTELGSQTKSGQEIIFLYLLS